MPSLEKNSNQRIFILGLSKILSEINGDGCEEKIRHINLT